MIRRCIPASIKQRLKSPATAILSAAGYFRSARMRLPNDCAVILTYHHVSGNLEEGDPCWAPFQRGVTFERFERQMRFLRTAMTPVSLQELVTWIQTEKPLPPRSVVVTFDDGYLDNFTVAYPVLKRYGIPATMFVSTGFVETDKVFWWDQVYSMMRGAQAPVLNLDCVAQGAESRVSAIQQPPLNTGCSTLANGLRSTEEKTAETYRLRTYTEKVRAAEAVIDRLRNAGPDERAVDLQKLRRALKIEHDAPLRGPSMMTWDQLREMSRNGVAIESHTHTHPILGMRNSEVVERELTISKELIEKHIGQPVNGVAYPDGRRGTYNQATMEIARATGFSFSCTTESRKVGPGVNLFSLGRLPVGNVSMPEFMLELLHSYSA